MRYCTLKILVITAVLAVSGLAVIACGSGSGSTGAPGRDRRGVAGAGGHRRAAQDRLRRRLHRLHGHGRQPGRAGHPHGHRHGRRPVDGPAHRVLQGRQRLRPGAGRGQGPAARGERRHPRTWPARSSRRPPRPSPTTWPRPAASRSAPSCGQPSDNLKTANGLAFMPNGLYGSQGYYFGKYAAERARLQDRQLHQLRGHRRASAAGGLRRRASREGGGKVLSTQYVPIDTVDFSSYLTTLKGADCTYFWVFGNGAAPFVKQYNDYGLTAPLIAADVEQLQRAAAGRPRRARPRHGRPATSTRRRSRTTVEHDVRRGVQGASGTARTRHRRRSAAGRPWSCSCRASKANGGDTTPAALIEAMSTITLDTPAGSVTDGALPGAPSRRHRRLVHPRDARRSATASPGCRSTPTSRCSSTRSDGAREARTRVRPTRTAGGLTTLRREAPGRRMPGRRGGAHSRRVSPAGRRRTR